MFRPRSRYHRDEDLSLRETLELTARTFINGVGLSAMGFCGFNLVQALRAGRYLPGAIAGGGLLVGLGHIALWQKTDGALGA